jgi:hypothetical protein
LKTLLYVVLGGIASLFGIGTLMQAEIEGRPWWTVLKEVIPNLLGQ